MAIPSIKSPEIADILNKMANRSAAIYTDKCVDPPMGCGEDAKEFRNEESRKEYSVSGLCQKCQDRIFGSDLEEGEG